MEINLGNVFATGECYVSETEILTENGWKKFKDMENEKVADLNPLTKELEWQGPMDKAMVDYDDEMYKIETEEGDLIVSPNHMVYAGISEKSIIGFIMMGKFFKNDDITFDLESQNKTSNMNSFKMTQITPEIFKVLNASNIQFRYIDNLFDKSLEQNRILSLEFLENSIYLRYISPHNSSSHLLSSSGDIALPLDGSFDTLFNFSRYSFFNGSSSTGCQSIDSQNSSSNLDNLRTLMYLSNISFFNVSSLITSDQLTHDNLSTLAFNSSSNVTVMLTIHIAPSFNNCSNFSNCSTFLLIPALITPDQFTSGSLSNLSFNSLGIDNVSFAIVSPLMYKQHSVDIGNVVYIYIFLGCEMDFSSKKIDYTQLEEESWDE